MISFIIIGRNEGWKLSLSLKSVFKTIDQNNLKKYEVIYVDSKSTDDSIKRAKLFPKVKIIQLTGVCNAAIARNVGVRESSGSVLFFIDGDMEIQPGFLQLVYDTNTGNLKHEFVSGQWINYNYDSNGRLVSKEHYNSKLLRDSKAATTGGLFLIKREIWNKIGGMKNKMRISEDLDLGLRLVRTGVFLTRKQELLAVHHTVPYFDKKRMWSLLLSGAHLYRVVLLREHIFNKHEWKLFLRGNYTLVIMMLSIVLSVYFVSFGFILLYFLSIALRTIARKDRSVRLFFTNLVYFPILEIMLVLGLFLFWPKNHKETYIIIRK